jgi:hypothetical protein
VRSIFCGTNPDIETEEAGKGLILTSSPSGFRYRITVSDLGVLSTTAVP